ncbi:hypothetical protein IQ266_15240 [filamentous cyanobacterium LEGE 11480]|uniref:Uncharacterized protein n=1 Tax=Romeriopsis navalis LEGE 11480 TaxID=2777977 RepID=A0A928VNU3_9CYAN|nr:hypothetical protein [Romeriopsis navalis]MBE9031088.1 hypothetical protein [Romeriopsis navalis LEGE 11480]
MNKQRVPCQLKLPKGLSHQGRFKSIDDATEELMLAEQLPNERLRRKRTEYHFTPLTRFAVRRRSTAPFGCCIRQTQQAAGN